MLRIWRGPGLVRLAAFAAIGFVPSSSAADAIRLTVEFTVVADAQRDPVYGASVSSGSFSVVTNVPPGKRSFDADGFNADAVDFSWTGMSWMAANGRSDRRP